VHLHQQSAGNPDAYAYTYAHTHTYTYAHTHAHAYTHAYAYTHTYAYAYAYTHTYAGGDTGRAAYSGTSYADGGSCHGRASGAADDRKRWRKAVGHDLACVGLVGQCYGLDAGGHGKCGLVAEAAE